MYGNSWWSVCINTVLLCMGTLGGLSVLIQFLLCMGTLDGLSVLIQFYCVWELLVVCLY